jgi:hydrocephalus-inducing protein
MCRFKWPDHPQLKFRPSVGHLHAGASKEVTVTFSSSTPIRLDAAEVKMQLSQITLKSSDRLVDWDDVLAAAAVAVAGGGRGSIAGGGTRSSMAGGGASRASVAGGKGPSLSGEKVGMEPANEAVQKTQRDLVVKVSYVPQQHL